MTVHLDHAIVPSRDRKAAAELLATLLGVPWAESGVGPFCPVYVNEGLTLDFDQAEGPFPVQHYCFRVSEADPRWWCFGPIGRLAQKRASRSCPPQASIGSPKPTTP